MCGTRLADILIADLLQNIRTQPDAPYVLDASCRLYWLYVSFHEVACKLVGFIKFHEVCKNQTPYSLIFADLLQVVKTT